MDSLHALSNKLSAYAALDDQERHALEKAVSKVVDLGKREDIIRQYEQPDDVLLLVDGWACRYKMLKSGKYRITALMLPGDMGDVHAPLLAHMDHSIRTLTPARVAFIPQRRMRKLFASYPRLGDALIWSMLVDEAILREWLISHSTRSAGQRVAHLLCEIFTRSRLAGLTDQPRFGLPLTQEELGATVGLSQIHVNRTLKGLCQQGFLRREKRRLEILDWDGLQTYAEFDDNYLHVRDGFCEKALNTV